MESVTNRYQPIIEAILSGKPIIELTEHIQDLHPSEAGDLIEGLPAEKRIDVWQHLTPETQGETLLEVHGDVQEQLIKQSDQTTLVLALLSLQLDEVADLKPILPETVIQEVLDKMEPEKRHRYHKLKDYPHNSAGGLMDIDAISIRSDIKIGAALRYLRMLREHYQQIPEHLDSLFVVDKQQKLLGLVSLRDLVSLPSTLSINEIMVQETNSVLDTTSASKVAQLFEDKDLISAPVVNEFNVLLGRITIDDVVDVIREQGEHLALSPAGVSQKADIFSPPLTKVKKRTLWLGINLINAVLSAFVIHMFSDSIEEIIALAVLMPIVASMGGVVGNQTLTLVTRGIALEQLSKGNILNLLFKEMLAGLLNGLIWGSLVGGLAYLWYQDLFLSLVFTGSLVLSLLICATTGTLAPIVLDKLNIDPALAGSVILVAISDVGGFFIFLGIATALLLQI